jgi:hypothetical protein
VEETKPSLELAFRRAGYERVRGTYSLVMRQTEVLPPVQTSHLMAGLKLGLLSMSVLSVAAPVQGSPLMFHDVPAFWPSLAKTAFSAAAARQTTHHQKFIVRW